MDYNSLLKLPCEEHLIDNRLYTVINSSIICDTELHWHEFYELEYIVSGTATQIVNGKSYTVSPGSVTLLSPVDFHTYHGIDVENPLTVINVQFQDLFLPKMLRNDVYMHKGAKIAHIPDPSFRMLLQQLSDEYKGNGYAKDTFLMNGIVNVCILVMRRVLANRQEKQIAGSREHSPIQEAVLYVRTHFRDNISAEAVAKTVHLSPNYFSEYFKKQTGEKFSIFVLRLRVEFAANLLRISDLSIKEVAFESGFNSAAYFSNTFKEFYGISPERYRKENRVTPSNT